MYSNRPTFTDYREYMKWRLDRRVETMRLRAEKVKRSYIDRLDQSDLMLKAAEADRQWLDKFCVGTGLDIACGNFLCGPDVSVGVDGDIQTVGTDYMNLGDELCFIDSTTEIDFIVTNYLDAFPSPLKALIEWNRTLKRGGVLAVVCRDADANPNGLGPLENRRRQSVFTCVTLSQLLHRAEFSQVKVVKADMGSLRAVGYKN